MHSETHLAGQGCEPRPCETCTTVFTPKRAWSRFCSTKCRNDFHAEERRKEQQRAAAPEMYEALLKIAAFDQGAEVTGSFDEPAAAKIARAALVKAGYKEPKPEKPKPEVAPA